MKPWPFRNHSWMLVAVVVLGACSGTPEGATDGGERSAGGSPNAGATPKVDVPDTCPHPHGGVCKGTLSAGTYDTSAFEPGLTYTVPDRWANMEDLPGHVLLLPPGRDIDGVDAGTADYLGVFHGVTVAAPDCSPEPMRGVGLGPAEIVEALADRPGLEVGRPREVSVADLPGLMIDIELDAKSKSGCRVAGLGRVIPLIIGVGPAELEHAQIPGLRTRLYVLEHRNSNIVIEVSDVATDDRPFDHQSVIRRFRVGQQ